MEVLFNFIHLAYFCSYGPISVLNLEGRLHIASRLNENDSITLSMFTYLFIYLFIYLFTYLFISYAKQMMKMQSNCVPVQPGFCSTCRKPYDRFHVTNNYLNIHMQRERM